VFVFQATKCQETALKQRIDDIQHHIHIESAIEEGSQNLLKHLRVLSSSQKKALQEVTRSFFMVVYREPISDPRSRRIVNRHPAISNKLATTPTPKPNSNPTLT